MVNGNDVLEHTERCSYCFDRQELIENGTDEETAYRLEAEIMDCFNNEGR